MKKSGNPGQPGNGIPGMDSLADSCTTQGREFDNPKL